MAPIGSKVLAREDGNALIEMAFVLPLLLFVVAGIIDFGFMFQRYEVVTNAAREGARLAVLPNYTDTDVKARVVTYLQAGGLTATPTTNDVQYVTIQLDDAGEKTMSGVTVTVGYPHTFTILGPLAQLFDASFGTIGLTATSTMRAEVAAAEE